MIFKLSGIVFRSCRNCRLYKLGKVFQSVGSKEEGFAWKLIKISLELFHPFSILLQIDSYLF